MSQLAQLLIVQQHDTRLDQLAHRRRHHPLAVTVADAQEALAVLQQQHEGLEAERHSHEQQRRRLSDEAASVAERRGEIEAKLYDGSVSATKELLAMQDEVAALSARQSSIEDDELEVMEQIESLDEELTAVSAAVEQAEQELKTRTDDLEAALADVTADEADEQRQRDEAAAQISPDELALYTQLRQDLGGLAIAKVQGDRCSGCNLVMPAVELDRLRRHHADSLASAPVCESCGRLLVVSSAS